MRFNVADIATLKPYYKSSQRISSPSVERWTFEQAGHQYTIVVEQGGEPSELATLKTKINDLIGKHRALHNVNKVRTVGKDNIHPDIRLA